MQIVYLAFARLPTEKAHGLQIVKTCEALARRGAEVTLVVPGRKSSITEDVYSYYGAEKNFSLLTLHTPDWVRWGRVGWGLSSLIFSELAKWRDLSWSADIVYSRDAFVLLQYVLLGRLLVYEAHTTPTWVSTFVARRAHRVVVISEGLKEAYTARGVESGRIILAHDAIDPAPFMQSCNQAALRKTYGVPEGRVALYVGRIEREKGAHTFAAASEYTSTRIVLIGGGKERARLIREFPKALFLPETKYRDLPEVLALADVLVVPNSALSKDASVYTSPLKAFAYLAAKKPIVATRVPALEAIFGTEVTYAAPDDPVSLAKAIDEAVVTPTRVPYTWDARAETILSHL